MTGNCPEADRVPVAGRRGLGITGLLGDAVDLVDRVGLAVDRQ